MSDDDDSQVPQAGRVIVTSPHVMDPGLIRYQLDNSDIIQSLSMKLRGFRFNPETNEVKYFAEKALINEDGIELLIETLLASMGHKGVLLSNFNVNETYTIARITMNDCAMLLVTNMDRFDIKDSATREVIQSMIRTTIMAILKRPFDQGERRFIKDTTEEKRVITEGANKGRGLFR